MEKKEIEYQSIDEVLEKLQDISNSKTRAMKYYAPLFISNSKGDTTDEVNELYNEIVRIHKNLKDLAFRTIKVIEDTNEELCDD